MKTTDIIYLSKKGMKELRKAVSRLERDRQKVIVELRDLDKTDSHDSRLTRVEKLSYLDGIESELADKRTYLEQAQLFPRRRKRDMLKVAIGSVVELIDQTGRRVVYTIVESIEANPSDGRISIKSPLGQRLIGKTIKDTIGLKTMQFQLVSIS